MKKIFAVFFAIFFCIILCTSCKPTTAFEPQSAKELWDKIDETMEGLNAYESTGTGKLSFQMTNMKFTMNMEMKQIVSGLNDGDYYYYSFSDMKLDQLKDTPLVSNPDRVMQEKSIEAFHNGKMFVSLESDERTQNLVSSLTKEEYKAYRKNRDTESDDVDYNDCTNASFTHNEDGTWTLQYSGYTKKTIDKMVDDFGMMETEFDFDVEDMEVYVLCDKKFQVKEMNVKFIFDEDSKESTDPFFEIKTQYANYNAVTLITDTLDPSKYTEISDCRLLAEFEDMIEALEEKKDGSFTLELEQKLSIPSLGQTQIYKETDTVSYGEKNGSYFYDITANANSESVEISYANGKQIILIAGEEQTASQTKAEAKAYINDLINTAKYSPDYVSMITKKADGVYEILCDEPDSSAYEAIFDNYAGDLLEISQTLTVTVKDGAITKIENRTLAKGNASTGYQRIAMEIEVTSTNVFHSSDNVTSLKK